MTKGLPSAVLSLADITVGKCVIVFLISLFVLPYRSEGWASIRPLHSCSSTTRREQRSWKRFEAAHSLLITVGQDLGWIQLYTTFFKTYLITFLYFHFIFKCSQLMFLSLSCCVFIHYSKMTPHHTRWSDLWLSLLCLFRFLRKPRRWRSKITM